MSEAKKVTREIRTCHQGEGFFLSLLSKFAVLHKVEGSNDIGIDYFCEWLNQEKSESSNVLFAVQLKTTNEDKIILENKGVDKRLNLLKQYEIKRRDKEGRSSGKYDNANLIKEETIEYWKGFEIPIYLFVVVLGVEGNKLFYKRYTPILHGTEERDKVEFYLANEDNLFLAYRSENKGGFCRDLFIDYIRCNYKKGSFFYKNPADLGLQQFPRGQKTFFADLIGKQYKKEFEEAKKFINEIDEIKKSLENTTSAYSSNSSSLSGTQTLFIENK